MTPCELVQRRKGQVTEMHFVHDKVKFLVLLYHKDGKIVDQVCWLKPGKLKRYEVAKASWAHLSDGRVVKPIYQTEKWYEDKIRYLATDDEVLANGKPHRLSKELQWKRKVMLDESGDIVETVTVASKIITDTPVPESDEIDLLELLAQQASVSDSNID